MQEVDEEIRKFEIEAQKLKIISHKSENSFKYLKCEFIFTNYQFKINFHRWK